MRFHTRFEERSRHPVPGAEIYGFWTPEQGTNPHGPFVNKHHFAGWMVMVLSLAMGVVSAGIARGMRDVEPDWRHRLLWLSSRDASLLVLTMFASLVMGLSLVVSLSRSGITAFALVVSTWLVARRQSSASRRTVGAAYLGFVVVVAIGWGGVDAVARRFAAASWQDVGGRLGAWNDALPRRSRRCHDVLDPGWRDDWSGGHRAAGIRGVQSPDAGERGAVYRPRRHGHPPAAAEAPIGRLQLIS